LRCLRAELGEKGGYENTSYPVRAVPRGTELHANLAATGTAGHGFATAALEAGIDVKTVSELMGHSSPLMVLTRYAHVSDAREREATKRIGETLLGARPETTPSSSRSAWR